MRADQPRRSLAPYGPGGHRQPARAHACGTAWREAVPVELGAVQRTAQRAAPAAPGAMLAHVRRAQRPETPPTKANNNSIQSDNFFFRVEIVIILAAQSAERVETATHKTV